MESEGQQIAIKAHASKNAIFSIIDNESVIYIASDSATVLNYDLSTNSTGITHQVQIIVTTTTEADTLWFNYFNSTDSPISDPMVDTDAGATLLNDTTLRLKLIAPGKSSVFVLSEANNYQINESFLMNRLY